MTNGAKAAGVSSPTRLIVLLLFSRKSFKTHTTQKDVAWHRGCPTDGRKNRVKKPLNRQLDEQKEAELSEAILLYLEEHPQAQDTAEGIASFWIMRQKVREDVEAVAMVLSKLTRSGQLEEIRQGKCFRYRRKKRN